MSTPSATEPQNRNDRLESVISRIRFLAMEWSLALGWIATLLLIWRVTLTTLAERFLPIRAVRLAVIFGILFLTIGSVSAMALSGYWLRRNSYKESAFKRWVRGIIWLGSIALLGRGIVWLLVEGYIF
ncbi:MAG: hypothetical protein RI985_1005 [Chloroflexota bacterium]|jgi:hypothetical protein